MMDDAGFARASALAASVKAELNKVVKGRGDMVERLVAALCAGGHVLIEGAPGLGKTLAARALAASVGGRFGRIQFTPDLMPSDVVGTTVYDASTSSFALKKGPVFANVLLADEVNRAPAKTQSALLEAMQERAVTIDGRTMPIEGAFFCVATQNPIEMEGTYPLPEAMLDRFMMRLVLDYPSAEAEADFLRAVAGGYRVDRIDLEGVAKVAELADLDLMREAARSVTLSGPILDYALAIVRATRELPGVAAGCSTRAAASLIEAARAMALIEGRRYAIPDDVKGVAVDVLAHRLVLEPEAALDGAGAEERILDLLASIEVPR